MSELDNGEGKVTLSDLRSNTWENADGTKYQFNSQNFLNERLIDAVDGHAERQSSAVDVTLTKPRDRKVRPQCGDRIPTEHVRRILDAAHAGKTILEFPIYDGSETGEKIYNTLTVIGHAIAADHVPRMRRPGGKLAGISAGRSRSAISARRPNRVSNAGLFDFIRAYGRAFRAALIDYNDFSIAGELKTLEIKDAKPCP